MAWSDRHEFLGDTDLRVATLAGEAIYLLTQLDTARIGLTATLYPDRAKLDRLDRLRYQARNRVGRRLDLYYQPLEDKHAAS